MLFRDFIDKPCGLRYVLSKMQLMSSCGRTILLSTPLSIERDELDKMLQQLRESYDLLYTSPTPQTSANLSALKHTLSSLRDISGTISRLKQNGVMDDIDLFEIKHLSLLNDKVKQSVDSLGIKNIELPDLEEIVSILDPDKMRSEAFYIYDSYSVELAKIRRELKTKYNVEVKEISSDEELELLAKEKSLEDQIRLDLTTQLRKYADTLSDAIAQIGRVDILLAKLLLIKTENLSVPSISEDGITSYKGMFYPPIVDIYNRQNEQNWSNKKEFTPIDMYFGYESVSIIGANMGGKTIVLKMLALNQLLFQFGFGVAAQSAVVDIKNGIEVCIDNLQNESLGLSSFASEMVAINNVIDRASNGEKILALIDEPARTTNPIEGSALVNSLIKILAEKRISSIITSHYNLEGNFFRRLRVRGLSNGKMDYHLEETSEKDIPTEAISVAKSLGINAKWIELAEKYLENNL